jgi:hypothetical protein
METKENNDEVVQADEAESTGILLRIRKRKG